MDKTPEHASSKSEIMSTHLIVKRHRAVDVRHRDEGMVCAEYIFENVHCFPVEHVGFLVLSLRVNPGVIFCMPLGSSGHIRLNKPQIKRCRSPIVSTPFSSQTRHIG